MTREPASSVLVKALSQAADHRLLPVSSGAERAQGAVSGLFIKDIDLIQQGSAHVTLSTSQRVHLLIVSPWALGFQHMSFGGCKHSDHNTIFIIRHLMFSCSKTVILI